MVMAKHTLELDDLELTALITHLEGHSEVMCESRLNSSNPSETPDREEMLLNLIYERHLQWVGINTLIQRSILI